MPAQQHANHNQGQQNLPNAGSHEQRSHPEIRTIANGIRLILTNGITPNS
jgi:hypothetical protein